MDKLNNVHTTIIIDVVIFFLFAVLFLCFLKLSKSLLSIEHQFCAIFASLDHLYIVSEVAKLKSFKNLLDCNETLLDEETI